MIPPWRRPRREIQREESADRWSDFGIAESLGAERSKWLLDQDVATQREIRDGILELIDARMQGGPTC